MRRIGDVLQPLLSEIDEIGGYRSPHMTPGIGGDADAARRGEALEARRDIDAVAVNVVRRHDDVAEIDADAQIDAAVLRQPGVPREDDPLHIQGTACVSASNQDSWGYRAQRIDSNLKIEIRMGS
jgi:hypothetical protein